MILDPYAKDSWRGFLELLKPPSGYRLVAAFGTTYGMSFDALVAALLAMQDTDAEALTEDPVAGVVAVTRLRSRVCVLLHPGTISGSPGAIAPRLTTLLDRLVREVRPRAGLFHPKVWVLRFASVSRPVGGGAPAEIARVLVCSRNLTPSRAFELGVVLEGTPATQSQSPSPISRELARALASCLGAAAAPPVAAAVLALPDFVRRIVFDEPKAAHTRLRLHWQGLGHGPLPSLFSGENDRALAVAPFVTEQFVRWALARTKELTLVSTAEALDALDDTIMAMLEERQAAQDSPSLYVVKELKTSDEDRLDGLHAKLFLAEDGSRSASFLGSANATGPALGISLQANVEGLVEMRPGLGLDAFVRAFIRKSRDEPHPWVNEYDRKLRADPDPLKKVREGLHARIRDLGELNLVLAYDAVKKQLRLSHLARRIPHPDEPLLGPVTFEAAPLALVHDSGRWTPFDPDRAEETTFDGVDLEDASAFVALRARAVDPGVEVTRVLLGRLGLSDEEFERRDQTASDRLLAETDPAAVLRALIAGLRFLPGGTRTSRKRGQAKNRATLSELLAETTLEEILEAVAADASLLRDLRRLVGTRGDAGFFEFCRALEDASATGSEAAL